MSTEIQATALLGYTLDFEEITRELPATTREEPRYDSKTGKPTKPATITERPAGNYIHFNGQDLLLPDADTHEHIEQELGVTFGPTANDYNINASLWDAEYYEVGIPLREGSEINDIMKAKEQLAEKLPKINELLGTNFHLDQAKLILTASAY